MVIILHHWTKLSTLTKTYDFTLSKIVVKRHHSWLSVSTNTISSSHFRLGRLHMNTLNTARGHLQNSSLLLWCPLSSSTLLHEHGWWHPPDCHLHVPIWETQGLHYAPSTCQAGRSTAILMLPFPLSRSQCLLWDCERLAELTGTGLICLGHFT